MSVEVLNDFDLVSATVFFSVVTIIVVFWKCCHKSSGQEETKLRNRCQKLKDDYSDLKTRNEYLEASNTEHKDRIQGLEINVQREKSSRSKAEQENVQLLVRLQKLEAEITLINSYLKKKHMGHWQWEDEHHRWRSFDNSTAFQLERAYVERTATIKRLFEGASCYKFDLNEMHQKNVITRKVRKIKREMSVLDYQSSPDVCLAPVVIDSDEYNEVEPLFYKTMPRYSFKIIEIQRVQSCRLWIKYQLAKDRLKIKNEDEEVNEKLLFHGTRRTKPSQIYTWPNGFDLAYARPRLWGKAIYFAENASYSKDYSYEIPNSYNHRQMFLAKVLTGVCCNNAPQDSRRTKPEVHGRMYDSLSGMANGSRVYAIFDNLHSYPYYLITYSPTVPGL
ncbi:protein mono-ADP-ribosyltransferase PARP11-like isoform X2 [Corticium candelabrum]|uniref:protein mono-ADP-ribosyltransferase PARP11-like isoform X2 n=1 Tax=Corticium candelabrum TaxID=121492 RepID=UPI002E26A783|nr:protein mono-ADP-ribosyltransferase PARP11-like isoform X2 [Corticium candelabrum]